MTHDERRVQLEQAAEAEKSARYDEAARLASEVLLSSSSSKPDELTHHAHALLQLGNIDLVRGCTKIALDRFISGFADHAERMTAAALEMQETITLPDAVREHMPDGLKLELRIGLHTGSVVAGVIGEERFVYDIYSDAVNTAARMESHGEEGRIYITDDYYRHLQQRSAMPESILKDMRFVERGELQIKGKGKMRTYFSEKA